MLVLSLCYSFSRIKIWTFFYFPNSYVIKLPLLCSKDCALENLMSETVSLGKWGLIDALNFLYFGTFICTVSRLYIGVGLHIIEGLN